MISGMGVTTSHHARPAGALALALASGCGSARSLDELPAAGSTSTSDASTTAPHDADASTDAPEPPPVDDLPGPVRPPPSCPDACALELPLVWSWEEPEPSGTVTRRLSAMERSPHGTLLVAEYRNGLTVLTHVLPDASSSWTDALYLSCDCEVVDMAVTEHDELWVLGEEPLENGSVVSALGSYWLPEEGSILTNWLTWDVVYGQPERSSRVGSVLPIAFDAALVLEVEVSLSTPTSLRDVYQLAWFEAGSMLTTWVVDTQPATDPPAHSRGVPLPDGRIAMMLAGAGGTGPSGYVVWIDPQSGVSSGVAALEAPADRLAAGPDGTVVAVGVDTTTRGVLGLHAAGLPHPDPPAWQATLDVATSTSSPPAVVVDSLGRTLVAVRESEAAITVWRIEADGASASSTSLPIASTDEPKPVLLALTEDDDLVLATLQEGRLHLERRAQACPCD